MMPVNSPTFQPQTTSASDALFRNPALHQEPVALIAQPLHADIQSGVPSSSTSSSSPDEMPIMSQFRPVNFEFPNKKIWSAFQIMSVAMV